MTSKENLDTCRMCPTCVHFIPYQDGAKDGRCTLFMGSYCSHTTAEHTCHVYEPADPDSAKTANQTPETE